MKTKKNLDKSSQSAKLKWVLPDKPQMIFLASILVLCIMILLNELLDFPAFLRGVKTNSIDWYKFATEMTAIMLVTFSGSVLLRKTESKRKRAEEALKESEEKYRALIEAAGRAGVGIIIIQDRGEGEVVFVFVNDQFCRMSGYSQSELVGRSPWNLVPREISIRLKDWYRRRHMGESLPSHYEAAGVCKNGTIMPLELSIVTMPWQGKIATVLYLRDITERKQAEEALRESEGRFRQLAENIDQVFWLTDWENDKLLYVNPSYEKLFGRSCQSAYQDRLDWYQVIHPDDRDRVKDLLVDNAKMGQNTEVKYRIIRDDGEVRWILDRNYPVRNQDGKIYRIVSIADDITERKQAERALKENEERLKLVLEGAELGTWDQNMKTGDVIRNRRWAEMLGYTLEEIEPNSDAWKALIHPDDLPVVNKIARDHETGRTQFFKCEHRMRTKLGEWKWILNCGKIIQWDSDGTPVRATGTHADITERKKAEEALRESQKRFQALTETTSDFVWEMDVNGVYTYCSPQIHELWGYQPEDMIGRTPFDLMMPEDREYAIGMFRNLSESPSSFKGMETSSRDNTGRIVVLETSGVPFSILMAGCVATVEFPATSPSASGRKKHLEKAKKNSELWRNQPNVE